MSDNFTIKKAVNSDFLQISALDRISWGKDEINQYIPDGEHAWRLWVEYALVFCCFENEKIVGVALAFPTTNNLFAVHKIFVDNNYRNNGYGSLLFEKLIKKMDILKKRQFFNSIA
jgi:phosphinothricin acetyltransferase